MSADAVTYCLERVTDYRDFERLCSALLAGSDYPGIDPLGGSGDDGRDAIIRKDSLGRTIVFAYTVRSDWRTKLAQDCERVLEKAHAPDVFVFVCTESLSASEKDLAHRLVAQKYRWTLDLFDLERLRTQIIGRQPHLIAQHPSVFTPPFFPQLGGQSVRECRDTLLIDHHPQDHALATWLARRLSLAGYRTWCQGTSPMAGENADDTVRTLLSARARLYLPVLSAASMADTAFLERCTIATARQDFVVPCATEIDYGAAEGPSRIRKIEPAPFSTSWAQGLSAVFSRLGTLGIMADLEVTRGRNIAIRDYLPARVTTSKPEPVFANVFPLDLPTKMLVTDLSRPLEEHETARLRETWAFAEISRDSLASFAPPPSEVPRVAVRRPPEFLWQSFPEKHGKRTVDIAKELVRRSLDVACVQKGLRLCSDRGVYYFPERESGDWNQSITHVDGRVTTVQLTGSRTKGWGDRAAPFSYQLAPRFRAEFDSDGRWYVVVRVYVRVATPDGTLFERKEIARRRKIVTKSWWNKEWLARHLGVVQALETSDGQISIGEGSQALRMSTRPMSWQCPVSLDVLALSGLSDIGEEIATYRARADGEAAESFEDAPPEVEA